MEKIKQALERARAQQDNEEQVITSELHEETPAISSVEGIQYSETDIVQMNDALLKNNRVVLKNGYDEADAAYRMLRTHVLQRMIANEWNSLAITSPGRGQGKTLTAINLAISLAREVNYTVLLVDFDLKRPGIHKTLGIKPEKGISDFILRDTPLNNILINPKVERLVLLPGRERINNSSEMLKSKKMIQLVDELKSRYPSRIIIFDLPPLLETDDALAFSPFVDSFLFVIEEAKTTEDEINQGLKLLKETNVMGAVLNKSNEHATLGY